ncbi:ATP-dependent Clp protease proteolytic subunit [Labilibaculum sp.]|uniref:ATP-dependent Clp protease proteolytic subunit n=1 Tax=Labilibaculum sp. TaxID=2060723 RepID=UPI002AA871A1|nr:ATP-dependent Clp protease proteolytic subunit [Labilibaculum sp.]
MSKKLLISVYAKDEVGRVDIIGSISEWNKNNAMDMRTKCQDLKDSGITKCHVYIMSVGGDCFQANEIVNILVEMFGSYTGDGGAIVASAGSYIAVNATSFEQAKNGQFMIHKPMGGVYGNETEIENYLALVKNMTTTYYDSYKSVLKKPEKEFKAKWEAGDFWMTADQAEEWGFVSKVKDPIKIDKETATAIKDSGSPIAIAMEHITQTPKENDMDLKATAIAIGMDANSTEEQVNARLQANAQKAADYDSLKAKQEQKEKEEKASKIKAELDAAEKGKRITADARPQWQAQFDKDFEGTKALLDGVQGVEKPLSADIKAGADGKGATYEGKTFEELQDEAPETLEALQDNNPEAYDKLFADWMKRNK